MIKVYSIKPVPAPRQVRKDKFNPSVSVLRYRAFRDEVRSRKIEIPIPFYHIIFILPMPKSWNKSKKETVLYQPHTQTPDKDNLEKALLDSVFQEDKHIHDGRVTKRWGKEGAIIISNTNLGVSSVHIQTYLDDNDNRSSGELM